VPHDGDAILDIPVETIDGDETTLAAYRGSVLLVVNVASKCGLTPQYEALEALYRRYRDDGLVVLGFPANDFGEQEPGSNDEIAAFCAETYAVDFPLFAKISVLGEAQHPLYAALTGQQPIASGDKPGFRENLRRYGLTPTEDPDVVWNFEKFLVDREGAVAGRFAPDILPDDPALVEAVERELARR
jgi:glutathione peroxidase